MRPCHLQNCRTQYWPCTLNNCQTRHQVTNEKGAFRTDYYSTECIPLGEQYCLVPLSGCHSTEATVLFGVCLQLSTFVLVPGEPVRQLWHESQTLDSVFRNSRRDQQCSIWPPSLSECVPHFPSLFSSGFFTAVNSYTSCVAQGAFSSAGLLQTTEPSPPQLPQLPLPLLCTEAPHILVCPPLE